MDTHRIASELIRNEKLYTLYPCFTAMPMKQCPVCRNFKAQRLLYYLKHIHLYHAHEPGLNITCGLSGCTRSFTNFYTYRDHVYAYHGDRDMSQLVPTDVHSGDHGGVGSSGEDYTTDREETQSPSSDDVLQRAAAMWILKTKEKHRIPQSSMEAIIRDVQGFLQLVLGEIHSALSSSLSEAALDASSLSSMASIFQPDSIFGNPFKRLQTQHLQFKYYKDNFGFVVSAI